MNICIFTKSTLAHQMGGMQVHCDTLAKEAVRLGHRVCILTTAHPKGIEEEKQGSLRIDYLLETKTGTYLHGWWKESVKIWISLHKEDPFDVIWSESVSAFAYALRAKPTYRVPLIAVVQGAGILGHLQSEWRRTHTFPEFSTFFLRFLPEAIFGYLPWFYRTLHRADAIVAVSHESARAIQREFFLKPDKISVVYNSVDVERFRPDPVSRSAIRKQYGLRDEERVLLLLGVMDRQKGMEEGVEIFHAVKKEIPQSRLLIVGSGPDEKALRHKVRTLSLEKEVIFSGPVSNDQTAHYYNACEAFLNPTHRVEGLSLVNVEAMACGRPLVSYKEGGTASTVKDGETGFLIPSGRKEIFVQRVLELLRDPGRAKAMGEKARERAEETFRKERMVEAFLALSQRLIHEGKPTKN